jgi:hypothetical protein
VAEVLVGGLRRALVVRLARRRQVPVAGHLVGRIASAASPGDRRRLRDSVARALLPRRRWRRLARSLLLVSRFEDAAQTFLLGVDFDRYLRQHHEGTLDGATAVRLREAVDRASARVADDLLGGLLRQGLASVVQLGASASIRVLELATAVVRAEHGDDGLGEDRWEDLAPLTWAARWVEGRLSQLGRQGMHNIEHGFDLAWSAGGSR